MSRTSTGAIEGLLQARGDYNTTVDLTPYLEVAESMVDDLEACLTSQSRAPFSTAKLELIARWLGAWAYRMSDRGRSQQTIGRSSGTYDGRTEMGLKANAYGQAAIQLDPSGCLVALDLQMTSGVIGIDWGGKPDRESLDWNRRN